MPLPPGPRREWRPLVERGLGAFNGLGLVAVLCADWVPGANCAFSWFVSAALALALYGFLGHAARRQRALAVLPSALLWLVAGIVPVECWILDQSTPPTVLALGLLFLAAAAVTVEFTVARLRYVDEGTREYAQG